MLNREVFFSYVRRNPFGGRLTPQQVDGLTKILNYWEAKHKARDIRWLAYILASVFPETAHTMQPVKERGGEAYLRSKKYYPYYGRGLIQITWKDNYDKFGIKDPKKAYEWDTSLRVTFDGMIHGLFARDKKGPHSLSRYFNETTENPKEARRIVNGTDKAGLIADYYTAFLGALRPSLEANPPKDVEPDAAKPDTTPITKDPQIVIAAGSTIIPAVVAAVTSPWGVAALVVLVSAIGIGAYVYLRNKEKWFGV